MKKIRILSESRNHSAAEIGPLDGLSEHVAVHKITGREIAGKIFLKDLIGSTGTEISFQVLPPYESLPFFHIHRKNEEVYIILGGSGEFSVDGDIFPVREGTVVRVAPQGVRGIRNTSGTEMVFMVIQSRENSLEEYSTDDGERVAAERQW